MGARTILGIIVIVAFGLLGLTAQSAHAYQEPNTLGGEWCFYCHPSGESFPHPESGGNCDACHAPYQFDQWTGPHGAYSTTTDRCGVCHEAHDSTGAKLLPAATIVGACFTCHDGTGGFGVYGTIEARTGVAPAGGHTNETASTIPGGDAATGGSATRDFRGPNDTLICSDCHSPHASNTVAAFQGDRRRVRTEECPSPVSTKLLKRRPTGATADVAAYGSDWCLSCHEGRVFGTALHNHPADSLTVRADPFTYSNLAILDTSDPTTTTIVDHLGGIPFAGGEMGPPDPDAPGNRGYLMPYPRTPQQGTHLPVCQQCHEDSRSVGTLSVDGATGDAEAGMVAAADSLVWDWGTEAWVPSLTDNPRFQNFPHETVNAGMLVETSDDLCLNCHPVGSLP